MDNYTRVLDECKKIAIERQAQYGEALESIKNVSEILSSTFDLNLDKSQICKVMISLKMARSKKEFHRDSWIDIVNYICILIHNEDDKR